MPTGTRTAPTEATLVKQVSGHLKLADTKRLKLALLLAASESVQASASFAVSVRNAYEALPVASPRSSSTRKSAPTILSLDVHPIREVQGFTLNLAEPVNPYLVYEAYGERQARQILDVFSATAVKEAAKLVEARNPGTKLRGRPKKPELIDYIMEQIASSLSS